MGLGRLIVFVFLKNCFSQLEENFDQQGLLCGIMFSLVRFGEKLTFGALAVRQIIPGKGFSY